ncbi:DsbA family protein [Sphingomonas gilva]|uniref:DsbA family protein n=1 Tax=Sphingomonas gilva TaxID=2305907 RepID=A0A396RR97_9SPHN|nr:DsbA family protein [Sphingomonas gilva]RHW18526.1 DsbA family protein [Sphingomonas gilva]
MTKGIYAMVIGLAALAGAGAMFALQATGQVASDPEKARIEAIVRDYILEHPEIIPEAIERLRARELAKVVDANRKAIETPFAGAWAGNPEGDVTVVEFFDYACGFCRQSLADVNRLIAEDKGVKVVFRELPVLSEESEVAARASLAAAEQGKFVAFHDALYEAGRPGAETIRIANAKAGIDTTRATAAMRTDRVETEIADNLALARQLGATGTPTWVVGDQVLNGAVGYEALKKAVAEARAK